MTVRTWEVTLPTGIHIIQTGGTRAQLATEYPGALNIRQLHEENGSQ